MAGIERIKIISDWDTWRTRLANDLAPVANSIYRQAFADIGMPLADGETELECTKEEAQARYDWKEGIDVIFTFASGVRGTHQEKFLTFHKNTVTFEERKGNGERGAWYYCTAQYYFVGYAREWSLPRPTPERLWPKKPIFQSWILVDLPALHRADATGRLPWRYNQNKHDGARASFRYIYFNQVPQECIISASGQQQIPQLQLQF